MDKIKISAKSYEEAIEQAMLKLETTSDNLIIDVISEGSSGVLGLFKKPWEINFSKKQSSENYTLENNIDINSFVTSEKETHDKTQITEDNKQELEKEKTISTEDFSLIEKQKELALKFLNELFSCVDLKFDYDVDYDASDKILKITINSNEDMGILIGKRGQTLDSLQYILSLVINKNSDEYLRLKLDTANYREKRKEKLKSLAKSIASKVKKTRRSIKLEPMNPYERRIIHSALQGDNLVKTKSEGEEPFRYIVIIPKNTYNKRKNQQTN